MAVTDLNAQREISITNIAHEGLQHSTTAYQQQVYTALLNTTPPDTPPELRTAIAVQHRKEWMQAAKQFLMFFPEPTHRATHIREAYEDVNSNYMYGQ